MTLHVFSFLIIILTVHAFFFNHIIFCSFFFSLVFSHEFWSVTPVLFLKLLGACSILSSYQVVCTLQIMQWLLLLVRGSFLACRNRSYLYTEDSSALHVPKHRRSDAISNQLLRQSSVTIQCLLTARTSSTLSISCGVERSSLISSRIPALSVYLP